MKKIDIISGIVLIIFAVAGFLYAHATTTPSSVGLSSNTFPQFLFVCLGICGVVLVTTSFSTKKDKKANVDVNLKGMLPVLVVLLIYILVFDYIHFIASTIVFLTIEMFLFGERNWKIIVPVAIIAPVAIFYLFTGAFSIILPA